MADKELVNLLAQLVAIPSVNPHITTDAGIAGEAKLADFLAGYLEGLGFHIRLDDVEPGRPNLVARFGPSRPKRTLLFESHLDTVGVAGMSGRPFVARVRNGRLHGRGACDTKGPMAAALRAFSPRVLERLAGEGWQVVFAGAMGEENGNVGAMRLVKDRVRADMAVILEPTELAVIHAHKGALWVKVAGRGRAAHGSNPDRGINAVTGMVRFMELFRSRLERKPARDPRLGRMTLNVGSMRGGTAVNIVPDACEMELDVRTLPGGDQRRLVAAMKSDLERVKREGGLTSFGIRVMKAGIPFQTSANSELVRRLKAACRTAGVTPKMEGAAWYSDAGPLSACCSQIVVFGPGSIAQAHTADEFIDLNSLQAGCSILREFLSALA